MIVFTPINFGPAIQRATQPQMVLFSLYGELEQCALEGDVNLLLCRRLAEVHL
jgi:hypothetical protein